LRFVSDEPGAAGEQGDLVSRLRAVIGAKDEQIAVLTAALEAALDRERRLELRLAEVERRLSMDSTDSGTPSSKERIGTKEARRARQQSERERRKDRQRGASRVITGKALSGIRTRVRRRTPSRRRGAADAGCPWTVRRLRDRGGRRSPTCRSSGR
jgi:hypothetical protein